MVASFIEAKGRPELLKTWVNTSLGETWEEEGETVDGIGLYGRRETYPAPVPEKALLLTAGVDVQRDRIEMEVVAWGEGEESWNVDYRVLPGDTSRPEVWRDLDDCLGATYTHETGTELHITSALIDSGDQTTTVYQFVKPRQGRRIFAGKGVSGPGRPVVKVSRKVSGKKSRDVDLYQVGVDDAKGIIYARLAIEEAGPGCCHFPMDRDAEYFAQLTAEKLMVKYYRGFPRREWVKSRQRNEGLDCRVYAFAALKILNPVWSAIEKRVNKQPVEKIEPELRRTTQKRLPMRKKRNWATDLG
jgi:phage terminase large subunit GpA-like protein